MLDPSDPPLRPDRSAIVSTYTLAGPASSAIPRPELDLAGKVTIVFLVVLGLGALAGGVALASQPDGSVMHFDVSILAGSPFSDFLVPGLVLGGLFGIGSLIVAAMGLRHSRLAPFLAFAIGCAQMIWIVVELAIIKDLSFLHPTFFGVGLVIAIASARWGWPTFQGWRAAR
jgi:hypothetical protein